MIWCNSVALKRGEFIYPVGSEVHLGANGPAVTVLYTIVPWLTTFGCVPMFYYLLHIPLIHALSLVVWFLRDGAAHGERFATAPYVSIPPGQRWGLPLVYLVWFLAVAILYPLCRWYSGVKARYPKSWLGFI